MGKDTLCAFLWSVGLLGVEVYEHQTVHSRTVCSLRNLNRNLPTMLEGITNCGGFQKKPTT